LGGLGLIWQFLFFFFLMFLLYFPFGFVPVFLVFLDLFRAV